MLHIYKFWNNFSYSISYCLQIFQAQSHLLLVFFDTLPSSITDFGFQVGVIPSSTLKTLGLFLRLMFSMSNLALPLSNLPVALITFSSWPLQLMLLLFSLLPRQIFLWLMITIRSSFPAKFLGILFIKFLSPIQHFSFCFHYLPWELSIKFAQLNKPNIWPFPSAFHFPEIRNSVYILLLSSKKLRVFYTQIRCWVETFPHPTRQIWKKCACVDLYYSLIHIVGIILTWYQLETCIKETR